MAEIEIKPWSAATVVRWLTWHHRLMIRQTGPKENDLTLCFYCTELHVMQ